MGYGLHNNFGIHACKFPPLYQLRRQFKAPDLRRQSSWWLDENTCGGKYMWTLTERTTNAGIWKATRSESYNSAVSYVDGNEIEGLFCSRIYYTQASGAPYRYQITYQRLGDGEKTWSAEEIMLKPTDYSRDALSCYDPGVAQWGNYYYLGYTSTKDTS